MNLAHFRRSDACSTCKLKSQNIQILTPGAALCPTKETDNSQHCEGRHFHWWVKILDFRKQFYSDFSSEMFVVPSSVGVAFCIYWVVGFLYYYDNNAPDF